MQFITETYHSAYYRFLFLNYISNRSYQESEKSCLIKPFSFHDDDPIVIPLHYDKRIVSVYSRTLRFCPVCIRVGFHSRFHQNYLYENCIFDGTELIQTRISLVQRWFPHVNPKDKALFDIVESLDPVSMVRSIPLINRGIETSGYPFMEYDKVWFYKFTSMKKMNFSILRHLSETEPFIEIELKEIDQVYSWIEDRILTYYRDEDNELQHLVDVFNEWVSEFYCTEMLQKLLRVFCLAMFLDDYDKRNIRKALRLVESAKQPVSMMKHDEDNLFSRIAFVEQYKFSRLLSGTLNPVLFLRLLRKPIGDTIIDRLICRFVDRAIGNENFSGRLNVVISAFSINYALDRLYQKYLTGEDIIFSPDTYLILTITKTEKIQLRLCFDES